MASSPTSVSPVSSFNRFHVFVLLAWQFTILFATQMLFGIFTTYTPRWRCPLPNSNGNGNASSLMNGKEEEEEMPFGRDCSLYAECPSGFVEFESSPFASAAIEFEWICGPPAFYKAFYSQVQFAGVLIGTLLISPLSDRFGRKPISLIALSSGLLLLSLSSLAPNSTILLIARFGVSLLMGGSIVAVASYTMEIMPAEHRMFLRTFCNWGIARLIFTFVCYLFPDWRSASIATAIASIPAILILALIIPESPTWLHSRGELEKMRQSEKRMAQFAGVPYVPVEHAPLAIKRPNFLHIIRNRVLLGRLLVLWMMWFCSSFSSYSIDLNSSNISGDLFVNQYMLSCPVIVSKILLFCLDSYWPGFSRRILHQCSQFIVCLCFLLLTALILLHYEGYLIVLAINQLGNVFIQYAWDACYLCVLEGMPTQIRSSSLGSCSLIAQFGAFLAPLFVFLNDSWAASAYLAVAIVGSLNLFVSYVWLVDTKGVDLDAIKFDSEEEAESGKKEATDGKDEGEQEKFLAPTNGTCKN